MTEGKRGRDLIQSISFKVLGDDRGSLVALEVKKEIPFEIKRVYYLYDTNKDVPRGFHAHKKLRQIAVCVSGSCRFVLDDGGGKKEIVLDSPNEGLLIDAMIWHEMHDFSEHCVLMVLANDYYDESDYIRDYDGFLNAAA